MLAPTSHFLFNTLHRSGRLQKIFDVLIVGAGQAGAKTAAALLEKGYEGTIAIVGAEPELPYERPPLSKEYLDGSLSFEQMAIQRDDFWPTSGVDIILGEEVVKISPTEHTVETSSGRVLGYGKLVWACGGKPRMLSCEGADLRGVHTVRTREDVDSIRSELPSTDRVVIIGGGYIGLEVAATLTKLGKSVTILEALDRVLARVAGEPLSHFYEQEHRLQGVDLRLSTTVVSLRGQNGRLTGVELGDGEIVPAEVAIVGIGIIPSVKPLADAGALCSNGVEVDPFCRTSLPDVLAAGDCALHQNFFAEGAQLRLESVQNADSQANVVAETIIGRESPYSELPWFWSNQFDLRLQTAGISSGYDQHVLRGKPEERSFSVIYLKDDRVVALDCVNSTKDFLQGKALIKSGQRWPDPTVLQDTDTPLKRLVKSE